MTGKRGPIESRFWPKVQPAEALECWLWIGSRNAAGYGQIHLDGMPRKAHRIAWVLLRGEIPDGLIIDHLCRVRACVNPWHMELVTQTENKRRGMQGRRPPRTHCPSGHVMAGGNRRIDTEGYQRCRTCENAQSLAGYHRRKAKTS